MYKFFIIFLLAFLVLPAKSLLATIDGSNPSHSNCSGPDGPLYSSPDPDRPSSDQGTTHFRTLRESKIKQILHSYPGADDDILKLVTVSFNTQGDIVAQATLQSSQIPPLKDVQSYHPTPGHFVNLLGQLSILYHHVLGNGRKKPTLDRFFPLESNIRLNQGLTNFTNIAIQMSGPKHEVIVSPMDKDSLASAYSWNFTIGKQNNLTGSVVSLFSPSKEQNASVGSSSSNAFKKIPTARGETLRRMGRHRIVAYTNPDTRQKSFYLEYFASSFASKDAPLPATSVPIENNAVLDVMDGQGEGGTQALAVIINSTVAEIAKHPREENLDHHKITRFLYIDADNLGLVNQFSSDWEGGTQYLRTILQAIKDNIRTPEDLVFRFGADEFVVVLDKITLKDAKEKAEKISASLKTYESDQSPFVKQREFTKTLLEKMSLSPNRVTEAERNGVKNVIGKINLMSPGISWVINETDLDDFIPSNISLTERVRRVEAALVKARTETTYTTMKVNAHENLPTKQELVFLKNLDFRLKKAAP